MKCLRPQSWGTVTISLIFVVAILASVVVPGNCFAEAIAFASPGPDSYVLTKAGTSFSTNATIDDIERFNSTFAADYLWVRRAGNEVVILDNRLITEAMRLFLPLDSLESGFQTIQETSEQIEKDQMSLDEQESDLERKLSALSNHEETDDSSPERETLRSRLNELKSKMIALEARADEVELSQSALESNRKVIGLRIESALWRLVDSAILKGKGIDPSRE